MGNLKYTIRNIGRLNIEKVTLKNVEIVQGELEMYLVWK